MKVEVVIHEIQDNQLRINNSEYFGLGVQKIVVGVTNPDKQEIVKDSETGLNYSRDAVEGQEIYKLKSQRHHPWFILDLETGSRGWFPGCEIHGNVLGEDIEVKAEPNEESETVLTLSNSIVTVLEIEAIDDEPNIPGWYKIEFAKVQGYIQQNKVSNIRYDKPF